MRGYKKFLGRCLPKKLEREGTRRNDMKGFPSSFNSVRVVRGRSVSQRRSRIGPRGWSGMREKKHVEIGEYEWDKSTRD